MFNASLLMAHLIYVGGNFSSDFICALHSIPILVFCDMENHNPLLLEVIVYIHDVYTSN